MSYRLAKSLEKLRTQLNTHAPNRSTISDGWIGDPSHASRESDHNPWIKDGPTGVVSAFDFTHDPMPGADMERITESIRRSKDKRVKYVIWNNRMFSSYPTSTSAPFTWRSYSGSNPHTKHAHVSVQPQPELYDSTAPWTLPKPITRWHLRATKDGKTQEAIYKSWENAKKWIRGRAQKGWKVIARKR